MSRSIQILFGVAVAMIILAGPALLLGTVFVYRQGIGNYSLEGSLIDYFHSQLAKWIAPPLIMLALGIHLLIAALIASRYQQRKKRRAAN